MNAALEAAASFVFGVATCATTRGSVALQFRYNAAKVTATVNVTPSHLHRGADRAFFECGYLLMVVHPLRGRPSLQRRVLITLCTFVASRLRARLLDVLEFADADRKAADPLTGRGEERVA